MVTRAFFEDEARLTRAVSSWASLVTNSLCLWLLPLLLRPFVPFVPKMSTACSYTHELQ